MSAAPQYTQRPPAGPFTPAPPGRGEGLGRRHLLTIGGLTVLGQFAAACGVGGQAQGRLPTAAAAQTKAPGAGEHETLTPAAAWNRLKGGNAAWISGQLQHPNLDTTRRQAVATGQHPFATIVSCIDSRVPPESVFDQGLGDLFVVRTGAQTTDPLVTGSIEYGSVLDGTPLIVVLGHQRCGAVTAAVEAVRTGKAVSGNLTNVVNALRPAVAVGLRKGGDVVDATVRAQINRTTAALQRNPSLARRVRQRKLAIVGAYYSLETGQVSVLRSTGLKASAGA